QAINGFVTVTVNGHSKNFDKTLVKSLTLDAGDGNDTIVVIGLLYGGATLKGGEGNDRLETNAGRSVLDGGAGNDTLVPDHGGITMIGGAGNDTADFSANGNDLLISLDDQPNDGFGGAHGDQMNVHS